MASVEEEHHPMPDGSAGLEYLTGPSRGMVTWLTGEDLDVTLGSNRMLRVDRARPHRSHEEPLAGLHRTEDGYEITVVGSHPVWVNGSRVTNRKLEHCDLIEFGEDGPLSRFCYYPEGGHVRRMVADILKDGLAYVRVSRQPVVNRFLIAFVVIISRLMRETTLLFRTGVLLAILGFTTLAWFQYQLNLKLEQRIESSASRLEGFAGVLIRAREEALTPGDLKALSQEIGQRLSVTAERLAELERLSTASGRVIAGSIPSVVFLQGAYGFREISSGRMLRHLVGDEGRPMISPFGQPMLSLDGGGPVAERQFTGTGFAVGKAGAIVTNRHVALPWEKDANIAGLAGQGLEPLMMKYIMYMPGKEAAVDIEMVQLSKDADLALLRPLDVSDPIPGLILADVPPVPGDEVIVMGYPTGLRSMLAQTGEQFLKELQESKDTGFWSVAARLAKQKLISPLSSRGIVSQASAITVVYDAETTHGGSGGPVLDVNGRVVAVNAAILPEYGGSNLGVPVAKVRALLEAAGLD